MDNLGKVSHQVVSDYHIIAWENLNVKCMVFYHTFAKHILDVSWGTFVGLLEYKADSMKPEAQPAASGVGG